MQNSEVKGIGVPSGPVGAPAAQENTALLYIMDGSDLFMLVMDTVTKKEISRTVIPTISFAEAARIGVADHRCQPQVADAIGTCASQDCSEGCQTLAERAVSPKEG